MRIQFIFNGILIVCPVIKATVDKNSIKFYYDMVVETDDYTIRIPNLTTSSGEPHALNKLLLEGWFDATSMHTVVIPK